MKFIELLLDNIFIYHSYSKPSGELYEYLIDEIKNSEVTQDADFMDSKIENGKIIYTFTVYYNKKDLAWNARHSPTVDIIFDIVKQTLSVSDIVW